MMNDKGSKKIVMRSIDVCVPCFIGSKIGTRERDE
jgi:hypothetical protein